MVLILFVRFSLVRADVIPTEEKNSVSLDGTWRFKIEQASAPPTTAQAFHTRTAPQYDQPRENFYKSDYREDADWNDIKVPSNWEMSGYSPATYHQPASRSCISGDGMWCMLELSSTRRIGFRSSGRTAGRSR